MAWFRISFDFEYDPDIDDLDEIADAVVERAIAVIDPTCTIEDELSEMGREWYCTGRDVSEEYDDDEIAFSQEISPN